MQSPEDGALARERFVVSGLSRLTVPVVERLLSKPGTEVLVIANEDRGNYRSLLAEQVAIVWSNGDHEGRLREALASPARCLLALDDDDMDNLGAAAIAYELKPDLPVVLRTLDSGIADEIEQLTNGLNVRRAYGMAALSAPAFVSQALLDEEPVTTMRFGDNEIPFCRMAIHQHSPLKGMTVSKVSTKLNCAVVAHLREQQWQAVTSDELTLRVGDDVILGGPQTSVLQVARKNSTVVPVHRSTVQARQARPPLLRTLSQSSLLRYGLGFLLILTMAMIAFGLALHLNPAEAIYQAVTAG